MSQWQQESPLLEQQAASDTSTPAARHDGAFILPRRFSLGGARQRRPERVCELSPRGPHSRHCR